MSMSENIKLIKQCQKGSNKAFDDLINQYSGLIYGICLRYCKNKYDADDLLQECLVTIIEKIKSFRFEGSFEGWIKRLSVNTAINYLRTKNKRMFDDIDDNINTGGVNADENVFSKMNAEEIIKLINQLPEGYRTVFNMHVIDGYKHVEIAEMLNITDSTSRSQYKKARELLIKKVLELHRI
jgi:RNA polymerase sigma factor (sigma-70 family)